MISIGDKVVCVDDMPDGHMPNHKPDGFVVKGCVYVVAGFYVARVSGRLRLIITGKRCLGFQTGIELGFFASRFCKFEDHKAEQELAYYRSEPTKVHA